MSFLLCFRVDGLKGGYSTSSPAGLEADNDQCRAPDDDHLPALASVFHSDFRDRLRSARLHSVRLQGAVVKRVEVNRREAEHVGRILTLFLWCSLVFLMSYSQNSKAHPRGDKESFLLAMKTC